MRVSVLAPIATSLYTRVVTFLLCQEPGIEVDLVLVRRPWSFRRIRSEWRRDGARLLRKVAQKMVLGDRRFDAHPAGTLLELARQIGLPGKSIGDVTSCRRVPLQTVGDHNSPAALALLRQASPDVVVFTGGGLLRSELLTIPRLGVLNCHMGLLPCFRGMDVVEWPLLEGVASEPDIGLTLHFMDPGVDTGPILMQQRVPLQPNDTFATIRRRMERDMALMMVHGIQRLRDGLTDAESQLPDDGRQYFVMHPLLIAAAERKLRAHLESLNYKSPDKAGSQSCTDVAAAITN
jgi:folate-dependent phosphoribosylglycinamide formyltransferase PurN